MHIELLKENSLYHVNRQKTEYNTGELMEIFEWLRKNNLTTDVLLLAKRGTTDEIIAYETWRAGVYNTVQSMLMGERGNLSDAVLGKLVIIYVMFAYPATTECAYVLHVLHYALMKGNISNKVYNGAMGAHLSHLTFVHAYIPYLNRMSQIEFPDIIEYPDAAKLLSY